MSVYRTIGPLVRQGLAMLLLRKILNQRTIGPENAHLKPDLGVLSHHEMTLTLNTHTPTHLY